MRARAGALLLCAALAVTALVGVLTQSRAVDAVAVENAPAAAARLTLSESVRAIRRKVDVPVALPSPLPSGTRPARNPTFHDETATLSLRFPDGRVLTIQYGLARFDGCGPTDPDLVDIAGRPGVIESDKHGDKPWTSLVWPATLRHPVGRYGLSGEFSRRRSLRLARSMARRVARTGASADC
jgi:hypothetical protein